MLETRVIPDNNLCHALGPRLLKTPLDPSNAIADSPFRKQERRQGLKIRLVADQLVSAKSLLVFRGRLL